MMSRPSLAVKVSLPPLRLAVTPVCDEYKFTWVATLAAVTVLPTATLPVPAKMATPLMLRLYVLAAVPPVPTVENAVVSVALVVALAVKPDTPAALMACTLAYAEPSVWPAPAPALLAPMLTAAPVPTCRVNVLAPPKAVAVTAVPVEVAT